ncbi:MAG: hypothetical protein KDA89_20855 [Planctomycetaceae bacterium]|nr:hypothetical protein [Planctomycetaceae bacterium]
MKRTILNSILQCVVITALLNGAAQAAEQITVAYRAGASVTQHFDDQVKASRHAEAVRKLGCEVSVTEHSGHTDVSYRSTPWRSLSFSGEQLAHQWEDWLKRAGFETLHAHPDGSDHAGHNHGPAGTPLPAGHFHGDGHDHGDEAAEVLSYRMADWSTHHSRDRGEASELTSILLAMGCEVRAQPHEDHDDVLYRCPQQMHIDLPTHQTVLRWESWMQRMVFRTQHVH